MKEGYILIQVQHSQTSAKHKYTVSPGAKDLQSLNIKVLLKGCRGYTVTVQCLTVDLLLEIAGPSAAKSRACL